MNMNFWAMITEVVNKGRSARRESWGGPEFLQMSEILNQGYKTLCICQKNGDFVPVYFSESDFEADDWVLLDKHDRIPTPVELIAVPGHTPRPSKVESN